MIINKKRHSYIEAHKVKGKDEYLFTFPSTAQPHMHGKGTIDCYSTLVEGQQVPCVHGTASLAYIWEDCYSVSFAKLPKDVQECLLNYIGDSNG